MSDKIIAIDGGAGSGKSSAAKRVAEALQWEALDTGSLYRLVAVMAGLHGVSLHDEVSLSAMILANSLQITGPGLVAVNGNDLSKEIRDPGIGEKTPVVAALPLVRKALLPIQRDRYLKAGSLVVEGRDIGSVVFPDADLKIWLVASHEVCRQRIMTRYLKNGNTQAAAEQAADDVMARDLRDSSRVTAPMIKVADAVEIDSTHMSESEVSAEICKVYAMGPDKRPSKIERLSANSPILWCDTDGVVCRRIYHRINQ